jgi:hypothetical protein
MYEECASRCENRRVVIFSDSSNILLHNKKNRIKDADGLTRISNNQHLTYHGLLLHTNLVFDQDSHEPLGNSHTMFIKRESRSRAEKGEKQKRCIEFIEEKESYKWIEGFKESKALLKKASGITLVADREADIIELIDRLPDDKTDIIIRSRHNRYVIDEGGQKRRLTEVLSCCKSIGKMSILVEGNKRKKREAELEIRHAKVRITWPHGKKSKEKNHKEGVPVNIIEVREKKHKGHKNEPALVWRLLTTNLIESTEQAKEVVETYKLRWRVEEYFKLLKSDCYDIENTELTKGKSIRKLILYVMKASIKIQQLKAARNGGSGAKLGAVFSEEEMKYLYLLNPELEGETARQQNPHPINDLAYGSWIIARLGGWKEFYDTKRPPGTKTFAAGIERFENIVVGIKIGKLVS